MWSHKEFPSHLCLQESEDLQINCLKLFEAQQKKMQRIMGPCACTGALCDYISLLYLPLLGTGFLYVKKWFKAQMSGILTDVFAYISHFVCSYNFNYTGRPLHSPGIIGSFALNYFIVIPDFNSQHEYRVGWIGNAKEFCCVFATCAFHSISFVFDSFSGLKLLERSTTVWLICCRFCIRNKGYFLINILDN